MCYQKCRIYWPAIALLLIFMDCIVVAAYRTQQRAHTPQPFESKYTPPYWEHILREFVYKTISPPPPANNELYRRLLEAPFFGGPSTSSTNGDNTLISQGDVFQLPTGRWILCQEGCRDCELCSSQKYPTVKWTLKRIKRPTPFNSPAAYDLQLTVTPQTRDGHHANVLWPRSYVYVTSQLNRTANTAGKRNRLSGNGPYAVPEEVNAAERTLDPSSRRPKKTQRPVGQLQVNQGRRSDTRDDSSRRASIPRQREVEHEPREVHRSNLGANGRSGNFPPYRYQWERKQEENQQRNDYDDRRLSRITPLGRPGPLTLADVSPEDYLEVPEDLAEEASPRRKGPLKEPRLIFGMDQHGRKHMVHIVQAGHDSSGSSNGTNVDGFQRTALFLPNGEDDSGLSFDGSKERIVDGDFGSILDSLKDHRGSIESFLFVDKADQHDGDSTRQLSPRHLSMYDEAEEDEDEEMFLEEASEKIERLNERNDSSRYQSFDNRDVRNLHGHASSEISKDVDGSTISFSLSNEEDGSKKNSEEPNGQNVDEDFENILGPLGRHRRSTKSLSFIEEVKPCATRAFPKAKIVRLNGENNSRSYELVDRRVAMKFPDRSPSGSSNDFSRNARGSRITFSLPSKARDGSRKDFDESKGRSIRSSLGLLDHLRNSIRSFSIVDEVDEPEGHIIKKSLPDQWNSSLFNEVLETNIFPREATGKVERFNGRNDARFHERPEDRNATKYNASSLLRNFRQLPTTFSGDVEETSNARRGTVVGQ